jgi:type II secretory pathway pseudopilin PulG
MAALLVAIGVMSAGLLVAMPAWRTMIQRDKEEELIFRGMQYARAVGLYQRKFGAAFPPTIDLLIEQRFLRKHYKDPVTKDGEFQILYQGSLAASQPGLRAGRQGPAGQRGSGGIDTSGARQPGGTGGGTSTFTRAGTSGFPSPGVGGSTGGVAGPQGGIVGVASKSTEKSVRVYNGRNYYNEWQFVYVQVQTQPGGGVPGRPGVMPGGQRGPGQPGTSQPGIGGPRGPGGVGTDRMRGIGQGGQPRPRGVGPPG